jgi:hypothetical protein
VMVKAIKDLKIAKAIEEEKANSQQLMANS